MTPEEREKYKKRFKELYDEGVVRGLTVISRSTANFPLRLGYP